MLSPVAPQRRWTRNVTKTGPWTRTHAAVTPQLGRTPRRIDRAPIPGDAASKEFRTYLRTGRSATSLRLTVAGQSRIFTGFLLSFFNDRRSITERVVRVQKGAAAVQEGGVAYGQSLATPGVPFKPTVPNVDWARHQLAPSSFLVLSNIVCLS